MRGKVRHQLAYSDMSNIVSKVPRGGQWTLIQTPRIPMKPIGVARRILFDVTRVGATEFDDTTLKLMPSLTTPVVEIVVSSFTVKEEELKRLVVSSRSLETDPERLKKLMKMAGESLNYTCYIVWLTLPFEQLPEVYKQVELQLFKLARNISDVHITILDYSKHSNLVADLMKTLHVDSLPVLIISLEPIDLKEPKSRNTVVIVKGKAFEWLNRHGKLEEFISNIPVWTRIGVLEKKEQELRMKKFLEELWKFLKEIKEIWCQVRSLILTNIQ